MVVSERAGDAKGVAVIGDFDIYLARQVRNQAGTIEMGQLKHDLTVKKTSSEYHTSDVKLKSN
jgi:hypothetical protein